MNVIQEDQEASETYGKQHETGRQLNDHPLADQPDVYFLGAPSTFSACFARRAAVSVLQTVRRMVVVVDDVFQTPMYPAISDVGIEHADDDE